MLNILVQNLHRYFLYIALGFLVMLTVDAVKGFWFAEGATGGSRFGIGVGSIVLVINVVLLGGYTLGCHSLRGGIVVLVQYRPAFSSGLNATSKLYLERGLGHGSGIQVVER